MKKFGNLISARHLRRLVKKEIENCEDSSSTDCEDSEIYEEEYLEEYIEQTTNCNCNCKEELKILSDKWDTSNNRLIDKINSMQNVIGKQTIVLRKLIKTMNPPKINLKIFPINSMEDLQKIDDKIKEIAQNDLIIYIKEILGRTPISKCIDLFFGENLLMKINWDGSKEKFAIKTLKMFNTHVFEAVKSESCGYKEYEDLIRTGIRIAKRRNYKIASRNRILKNSHQN